jgi:Tfp pilus assembly protein PilX
MKEKQRKGFTLLFATLIVSLILTIGLSILSILLKESILVSTIRDSEFAFYAADSGGECALYWDRTFSIFDSSPGVVRCNDSDSLVNNFSNGGWNVSEFTIEFLPQPYCSVVSVQKNSSTGETVIISRGYNTCNDQNPRKVERAIRISY